MAKAFYVLTAGKLEERQVAAGLGEDIGIRPPPGPRILQVSEALHVTLRLHASAHHGAPPLFPQVSEALHVTLRLPKPVQVHAAARTTHGSACKRSPRRSAPLPTGGCGRTGNARLYLRGASEAPQPHFPGLLVA